MVCLFGIVSYGLSAQQWTTTGSDIYNSNTGNVGVGISTPNVKLHVKSNNPYYPFVGAFKIEAQSGTNGITMNHNGSEGTVWLGNGSSSGPWTPLRLYIGGTTSMFWATNGNVGVGNSNPAYKLDVSGTINATGLYVNGVPFTGGSSQWTTSGTNIYYSAGNIGAGITSPTEKLHIVQSSATNWAGFFGNSNATGKGLRVQSGSSTATASILQLEDNSGNKRMIVRSDGKVGIGTLNPDYLLTVNGKIKSEELQVVVDVPADYVFETNYPLLPLDELEKFVREQKHLPGVPSATELVEKGWSVGDMSNKLLEKVEELTLYMLQLKQENELLKERVKKLESTKE